MSGMAHRRTRNAALVLLSCSLLFLSSCTFRFIYDHLDWIIPWYVNDFFSLNTGQDSFLEKQLKLQLRWHRRTQLQRYAELLRQIRDGLDRGLTQDDLTHFHRTLRAFWQDLIKQIGPDIGKILSDASDKQVAELLENLKLRRQAYKEEYIDPPQAELIEIKAKRMRRFLEYWMDDLTDAQVGIVDEWARELKPIAQQRLAYVELWQQQFSEMLTYRKDETRFTTDLCNALCFYRKDWPSAFTKVAIYNRELTMTVFLTLDRSLTEEQRREFMKNLDKTARTLEEMAAECD